MRRSIAPLMALVLMIASVAIAWGSLQTITGHEPMIGMTHKHDECPKTGSHHEPHDMSSCCMNTVLHCSGFAGLPATWRLGDVGLTGHADFPRGDVVLAGLIPEAEAPPPRS